MIGQKKGMAHRKPLQEKDMAQHHSEKAYNVLTTLARSFLIWSSSFL